MQTFAISASLLLCIASCVRGQTFDFPEPTGQFVPGVHDFEFLDTVYPSYRDDESAGRRLLVRVWYPACRLDNVVNQSFCGTTDMGRRRFYFENGEGEVYTNEDPGAAPLVDALNAVETSSFINASVASGLDNGTIPVVIFSHGLGLFVSLNTALMQELASQGYAVFAIAHPGFASGVLYSNGDVVKFDEVIANETASEAQSVFDDATNSSDIEIRYDANKQYIQNSPSETIYFPRFRDDQLALADYLRNQTNGSSLLGQLTGEGNLNSLVYMGHSFGGAAAASSVQLDDGAQCSLNMDGYQYSSASSDLFGKAIRTPFLTFVTDRGEDPYFNEFFYEPLASMGSDPMITRVRIFNSSHTDLTDYAFLPDAYRDGGTIDGGLMHEIIVNFTLGFFSTCSNSRGRTTSGWTPESSFQLFTTATESVNVTYVAEWAQEYFPPTSQPKPQAAPASQPKPQSAPRQPASAPTSMVSSQRTARWRGCRQFANIVFFAVCEGWDN
jgi:dienelactone hydrolase